MKEKQRFNIIKVIIAGLLSMLLLTGCSIPMFNQEAKLQEGESFMMGTVITQRVYGGSGEKVIAAVNKRLKEIEELLTINSAGGEINSLNEASGKSEVKLGSEAITLLNAAKKYAELSGGAFDVTIGPLVKAWGVFTDNPRVPAPDEIEKLKKLVDFKKLIVNDEKGTARLEGIGQIVDLGGIAKGYAGDEAIKIYKENGIKSAYINLGGNVVVLGTKPDGKPWRIGIQNPRSENGRYIGVLEVLDKTVVTSGDYERFFEKDGKRYHHIIDPKTGYPADSGLISATIVTGTSMDADALSTATFVLGLDKGRALVNSLKGVEAIFITKDKEIYITEGLKDSFTFSDETGEFKYVQER